MYNTFIKNIVSIVLFLVKIVGLVLSIIDVVNPYRKCIQVVFFKLYMISNIFPKISDGPQDINDSEN